MSCQFGYNKRSICSILTFNSNGHALYKQLLTIKVLAYSSPGMDLY